MNDDSEISGVVSQKWTREEVNNLLFFGRKVYDLDILNSKNRH